MRWFTSDTHFSHRNIIKYSNRPFRDVSHMNEVLIENWNNTVGPDDTVYHLGDVALGPWVEWDGLLERLNGYKVLIVGNHDRIFRGMSAKEQKKFQPHYHRWFDETHDNLQGLWLDDGTIADLSHFPYESDHTEEARYMEYRLPDRGRVLIHGHTHSEFDKFGEDSRVSRSKRGSLQIHVGVDAWQYRPVSEDEVISLVEKNKGKF